MSKAQVTLVITVSSGQVMHKALNLCRVNPEASQHEIQNPWKDEGVRMCWTKKKIDSNYQLLHCIFHRSHHFQQELQKKSRAPGISKQLITSHISKERTALQQEIKASKLWDLLPDCTPHPNVPSHPKTHTQTPSRSPGALPLASRWDVLW